MNWGFSMATTITYFIEAVGAERIKIGRTDGPSAKRLRALQTGCPFELHILAQTTTPEKQLHLFFAPVRVEPIKNEWFHKCNSLTTLITHCNRTCSLPPPNTWLKLFGAPVLTTPKLSTQLTQLQQIERENAFGLPEGVIRWQYGDECWWGPHPSALIDKWKLPAINERLSNGEAAIINGVVHYQKHGKTHQTSIQRFIASIGRDLTPDTCVSLMNDKEPDNLTEANLYVYPRAYRLAGVASPWEARANHNS